MCLFFLKTNNDRKITVENIASAVTFMWMDCCNGNIIDGFESVLSKVLLPVLRSQKVRVVASMPIVLLAIY